jgi:tRNA/tmRNA/rRNA uracil-C5-methylase (TrmA/RlmC/RlmD family)
MEERVMQIRTITNKDGSVDIHMSHSTPQAWFTQLKSCVEEIQERLEKVDVGLLNDDDQQIFECAEHFANYVSRMVRDLENELDMQQTDSPCEFFYGNPTPPAGGKP